MSSTNRCVCATHLKSSFRFSLVTRHDAIELLQSFYQQRGKTGVAHREEWSRTSLRPATTLVVHQGRVVVHQEGIGGLSIH